MAPTPQLPKLLKFQGYRPAATVQPHARADKPVLVDQLTQLGSLELVDHLALVDCLAPMDHPGPMGSPAWVPHHQLHNQQRSPRHLKQSRR